MGREEVLHELWVSNQMRTNGLSYLPDIAGGYATSQHGSVGFVVRSASMDGYATARAFTLPGFSLYGGDALAPDDPPLLAQLPQLFGERPVEFLANRVVIPAVQLWVRTVVQLGLIPELHGQNALLWFDGTLRRSAVCGRDSDLFALPDVRRSLGLDVADPRLYPVPGHSEDRAQQYLSLCYDGFLSHHFLERLASVAVEHLGIEAQELRNAAKYAFRNAGGAALPLTKKMYYYDDNLRDGEEFGLVEFGGCAPWR